MSHSEKVRTYLTDGASLWRIYTAFIHDDSFYYEVPSNIQLLSGKFSYHPDGTTHFKNKDRTARYRKIGWSAFGEMTISPIDSFGFRPHGPYTDDLVFRQLMQSEIKHPALVFDIRKIPDAFILRMYLGKTEEITNDGKLLDKVAPAPPGNSDTPNEQLIDIRIHNFKRIETALGSFDLSLAVALIATSAL
jgi:hypothetical protein